MLKITKDSGIIWFKGWIALNFKGVKSNSVLLYVPIIFQNNNLQK